MNTSFRAFAEEIAREAGQLLLRYQRDGVEVESKSNEIDLVTSADRASEALLIDRIQAHFPTHQILAEEDGSVGDQSSDLRWVLDPLDGTVNFAHGQPHFCVLVSLEQREGAEWASIACATFDPHRDEMFSAASGEGAWLNGKRLQVSSTTSLRDACGATGFPYGRLTSEVDNHREFCAFSALTRGLRRNGAAGLDLAWLAAGRFDFYWEYDLSRWDESGGILLVREAGGEVGAFREQAHVGVQRILASNGHLHEAALTLLESSTDYPVNDRRLLVPFLPEHLVNEIHGMRTSGTSSVD